MYRIKEILHQKGLKVGELADKLGMAQPNVSNIINGKTNPSIDTLKDIARALNVSVKELFSDEGINGFIKINGELKEVNSIADLEKLLEELKGKE